MRLIDADATIYALNVASRGDSKDVIRNLVICFLLASPTVDAEPVRHGKWLCSDDIYETAVCSVCNFDTGEPYEYVKKSWNFCPNCGAKMERKEE